MIDNFPEEFPLQKLDDFHFGAPEGKEDDLLENHICFCQIPPITEFLTERKSIVVGERGTGKTALFRLISDGRLGFSTDAGWRGIVVPIEEELDFKTFKSTIINRIRSTFTDDHVKYRIVWEVFILHRILTTLLAQKCLSRDLEGVLATINSSFDVKETRPTLVQLLLNNKKTIGVKVDSNMPSMPINYYASLEPATPTSNSDGERSSLILNLDQHKKALNKHLGEKRLTVHVLVDKLDQFVTQEEYDIQMMLLQGLLHSERSYHALKNLRIKFFIRRDLFDRLNFEALGYDKILNSKVELHWTNEDIREFIARRISFNFNKVLGLDRLVFRHNDETFDIFLGTSKPLSIWQRPAWLKKRVGLIPQQTLGKRLR